MGRNRSPPFAWEAMIKITGVTLCHKLTSVSDSPQCFMPSVPCPNLPPSSAVGRSPLSRASSDNAALLLPTQFVQGWAARTTAGVSYNVAGGAKILVGVKLGHG